jgi:F-type H+-transporting ATPase subunit epsilon
MDTFTLVVRDANGAREVPGVASFVGEDASGAFGILAGHARMMTSLSFGLARFRLPDADWQYIALSRAVLYFRDNVLTLNTRRYLMDANYTELSQALTEQLLSEEQALRETTTSLRRMEEEMLRRLWELGRRGA